MNRLTLWRELSAFFFLGLLFFPITAPAADCYHPHGVEGQIIYASTQNVPVYCNGFDWIAMGQLNPAAGGSGCATVGYGIKPEGYIFYNLDNHVLQYCDGDDWRAVGMGGSGHPLSGPADCPAIGDKCDDDTVFAGFHPVFHKRLFVPPVDQGHMAWRSSGSGIDTGAVDIADGRINQQWIEANRTIANYPAFNACAALNAADHLGHDDWYLPSRVEIYHLWAIRTQLESKSEVIFQNAHYWSSTDSSAAFAFRLVFGNGFQTDAYKTTDTIRVSCVRR